MRRKTIQRSIILETVNKLKCHATADEVYNEVARENPHISRSTVYRNLNLLAEMGEIRKMTLPGHVDRFDHLCYNHYHVRCEKCGRIFDLDMDYISELEKNIKTDNGFKYTGHDIFFRGICPDCNH